MSFCSIRNATIVLALCILLFACVDGEEALTIKGSDTVLPLAQKLAEVYMKKHPERIVVVTGGGSGVGVAALIERNTKVANTSRLIKKTESALAQRRGIQPVRHVIARDGITVVVHPENPIDGLTLDELKALFSGRIRNWKELGGEDENVVLYSREVSSGTYAFFKDAVLGKTNFAQAANLMPGTGSVVQSVSQTRGGIGYIGVAYLNDKVKGLNVAKQAGSEYIEPRSEHIESGIYPLGRELFQYSGGIERDSLVRDWFEFVYSDEGQRIVRQIGYIPVR